MMTLDEAIVGCEEEAFRQDKLRQQYKYLMESNCYLDNGTRIREMEKCARASENFLQIAEWLKDYREMLINEKWAGLI